MLLVLPLVLGFGPSFGSGCASGGSSSQHTIELSTATSTTVGCFGASLDAHCVMLCCLSLRYHVLRLRKHLLLSSCDKTHCIIFEFCNCAYDVNILLATVV